ncbi:MarR family transcriptional regulator [bacterium]|nr:MarR family transcriptional regulator [bacterium]MCI0613727.1 MarR family transcriptional regulator [bacterium]
MIKKRSQILDELKQKKPFSSLSQTAVVGLLRTADILRRGYYSVVEKEGISPQQYNILRILRGAETEGLPTLEIANRLLEKSPGITRFIDQMEILGFIERKRSTTDRRQVFCVITKSGLNLIGKMDNAVDSWDHGSLSMLSQKELKTLIATLDRIRLHYTKQESKVSAIKEKGNNVKRSQRKIGHKHDG